MNYSISFLTPWYLALLGLLPALWWLSFRRLALLGPLRRTVALMLRTAVVMLVLLALAETQWVRTSDRLTVIYLLDQSLSIPADQRQEMIALAGASIRRHRKHEDRVGVVVFGREPALERPPRDDEVQLPAAVESRLDPESTNLAAAMRLAQASFPEDAAKRIVIVSDGNQNIGDALGQAQAMAASGIGIDVVPVRYARRAEVAIQRLVVPDEVRRGEAFELKAIVSCDHQPDDRQAVVSGRLEFRRLQGDQAAVLNAADDQRVTLRPGKNVFTLRQTADASGFYTYEARFIPDRPEDDATPQNNRATAFTQVRGKGHVLLLESRQDRGHYDRLAERLRRQQIEVTVRSSGEAFAGLAELQPFDAVILADVPREDFSDAQITMLVRNTQQMGSGLVMLGGPNSFGPGGWTNSELEAAMPVDFQVDNQQIVPRGALALVIDKSGSMAGEKIEVCKTAAIEAARVLGPQDSVAVVAFDVQAYPIVPLQPARDLAALAQRLGRLAGTGGTNMEPGMLAGYQALRAADASVKHLIVLTDGITAGANYQALAARWHREGITVSSVAVGPDADRTLMREIATAGGGESYVAPTARAVPRIFQREARRVARPLVYESPTPLRPAIQSAHEMLRGIREPLPPISGFVLTSRKQSPLVETALVSPQPDPHNNTILASWTYGLGRVVAFTSDAAGRWTGPWSSWADCDKFFGQIVRWAMRPIGEADKFTVASDLSDGCACVVVSALDNNDRFLNFLSMSGTVVGPDLQTQPLKMEQTAPGRYVGTLPARDPGSYLFLLHPGAGQATIRAGINVPYGDEFRDRASNDALLARLAAIQPEHGPPGRLLPPLEDHASLASVLAVDMFRHDLPKATSRRDAWHVLVLMASCLFLVDIFVRRVQVRFGWLSVFRRGPRPAAIPGHLERLRSRKAQVAQELEQIRDAARLEVSPGDSQLATEALEPGSAAADQTEAESHTARLLRAKKEAWKEQKEDR